MSEDLLMCNEHCLDCQCGRQLLGGDPPGTHIQLKLTPRPLGEPIPEYVNHPDHYQGNSIEVIDVIEDFNLGFNLGNAIKYILRAGKKDNRQQELKKAIWYLQRELKNRIQDDTQVSCM